MHASRRGAAKRTVDLSRLWCPWQVVGRLAARLALVLQGKDKPTFTPNSNQGDVCIVINASKAVLTGKKWDDKTYVSHTGAGSSTGWPFTQGAHDCA